MKKLVQINVVCNGSTGRIMCDIAKKAQKNGFDSYCFYGRGEPNKEVKCIKIGNKLGIYFHVFLTRIFNKHGHGSYFATKKMIKQIKKIKPDIIHLHNIHGYYLNLKVLFKYLKNEFKGKVIWTLHDCWSFTGNCAHFTAIKCNKWKKECYKCPQIKTYPKSYFFDTSNSEYFLKKKLFTSIDNMKIILPSYWLASLVKSSFFRNNKIEVINNGINLDVFKPTFDNSIYKKYGIPNDKKLILGVANNWEEKKGLDIFINLSKIINNDEFIVLVGLSEKQILQLPKNIIGIQRTENMLDLAKIYTIASIFVNPSLEETFSLVTAEALSCGTPVVVCNSSATQELINEKNGLVVTKPTTNQYYKCIKKILSRKKIYETRDNFPYDNKTMLEKYLRTYEE